MITLEFPQMIYIITYRSMWLCPLFKIILLFLPTKLSLSELITFFIIVPTSFLFRVQTDIIDDKDTGMGTI